MPDNSVEIAYLESLLNGAETSSTIDGSTTAHDLDAARKRLETLKRNHVGSGGERHMVKPVSASIRITGL